MRFSFAISSPQPPRDVAAELVRRLLKIPAPRNEAPELLPQPNLPQDLDQRVRATGEW